MQCCGYDLNVDYEGSGGRVDEAMGVAAGKYIDVQRGAGAVRSETKGVSVQEGFVSRQCEQNKNRRYMSA